MSAFIQFYIFFCKFQVPKWKADNKFEFLVDEGADIHYHANVESAKILTPAETQSRLLQLMNADENCDCIKGWVQVIYCLNFKIYRVNMCSKYLVTDWLILIGCRTNLAKLTMKTGSCEYWFKPFANTLSTEARVVTCRISTKIV